MVRSVVKKIFERAGLEIERKKADPVDFLFRQSEFRTIIDVGADVGHFAVRARRANPKAVVHSFEPLPPSFEKLQQRMQGDPAFRALPYAIGDRDGETDIMMDDFSPASSILPMTALHQEAFPRTGSGKKLRVPLRTLDGWSRQERLEEPILLKIDVQGYEEQVLKGAAEILQRIRGLILEVCFVELYKGQLLFTDLHELIGRTGFVLLGIAAEAHDPRTGLSLYADAYYLRSPADT